MAARHKKAGHVESPMISNYTPIKIRHYIYNENSPLLNGIGNMCGKFQPVNGWTANECMPILLTDYFIFPSYSKEPMHNLNAIWLYKSILTSSPEFWIVLPPFFFGTNDITCFSNSLYCLIWFILVPHTSNSIKWLTVQLVTLDGTASQFISVVRFTASTYLRTFTLSTRFQNVFCFGSLWNCS
jgi:hypothetical protein